MDIRHLHQEQRSLGLRKKIPTYLKVSIAAILAISLAGATLEWGVSQPAISAPMISQTASTRLPQQIMTYPSMHLSTKARHLLRKPKATEYRSEKQIKRDVDGRNPVGSPKNQFEALSKLTGIVADTGDIKAIKQYSPEDATTNPSLILSATKMPEYQSLLVDAVKYAMNTGMKQGMSREDIVGLAMDRLAVNFGTEISKIIPGLISTEVDARLSFDTDATVARGRRIVEMYKENGVDTSRVLIKIASTWEGIKAAEILEAEGIKCNLTLLFSMAQAIAACSAGAFLISPFVGRITDWHTAKTGTKYENGINDPGVESVRSIYNYYKKHGADTVVMGASFRNKGQIIELAGCDKLTIGPKFLKEMLESDEAVPQRLCASESAKMDIPEIYLDEKTFRYMMNEDAMATEKLAEGIRGFAVAAIELEDIIKKMLLI